MTTESPQVFRSWTGWIRTDDREAYREYLEATGLSEYRQTPGCIEAFALYRDLGDGRTEVVTLSRWQAFENISAFAGDNPSRAVFYPDDDRYLIDRQTTVRHYQIVA